MTISIAIRDHRCQHHSLRLMADKLVDRQGTLAARGLTDSGSAHARLLLTRAQFDFRSPVSKVDHTCNRGRSARSPPGPAWLAQPVTHPVPSHSCASGRLDLAVSVALGEASAAGVPNRTAVVRRFTANDQHRPQRNAHFLRLVEALLKKYYDAPEPVDV
jgi:hypothetical protein